MSGKIHTALAQQPTTAAVPEIWRKAPAEATHYFPGDDDLSPLWLEKTGDEWRCMVVGRKFWSDVCPPLDGRQIIDRPAAEQPDTVKVSRELLREFARIFEVVTHSELVPNDLSQQTAAALIAARATLAGGDKP